MKSLRDSIYFPFVCWVDFPFDFSLLLNPPRGPDDAAGAVVIEAVEGERGILSTHSHSDGSYLKLLYQPGFGTRHMPSEEAFKSRNYFLQSRLYGQSPGSHAGGRFVPEFFN